MLFGHIFAPGGVKQKNIHPCFKKKTIIHKYLTWKFLIVRKFYEILNAIQMINIELNIKMSEVQL